MTARIAGLVLLLGASLCYVGLVRPARRDLALVQDDFARSRDERERLRARMADLERRVQVRARITAAGPEPGRGDSASRLRNAVLRVVDASRVSGVTLSVSAGRVPVAAKVHLTAEGRFADLVPLTGRLVSGPPGLVLERLRLTPVAGRIVADLEAFRLEGAP
jgi:hypothetical protein